MEDANRNEQKKKPWRQPKKATANSIIILLSYSVSVGRCRLRMVKLLRCPGGFRAPLLDLHYEYIINLGDGPRSSVTRNEPLPPEAAVFLFLFRPGRGPSPAGLVGLDLDGDSRTPNIDILLHIGAIPSAVALSVSVLPSVCVCMMDASLGCLMDAPLSSTARERA